MKNITLALFKQRIRFNLKYLKTKANELLGTIAHRIEVKRLLDSCPDEKSRRLMLARIQAKEEEIEIRYARFWNYHQQMTIGFLDMVEAISMMYDNDSEIEPTKEQAKEAIALFDEGKAKLLMYSSWMGQLNPGSCALEWVRRINPITLDSFHTINGWLTFIESLPVF